MRTDRVLHWQRLMNEQAASGLTIKDFCTKRNLSRYQFYKWRQRLRKATREGVVSAGFIQLLPVPDEGRTTIRIHLGEHLWIEVAEGFHPPTLRAVIETLARSGNAPCLP